MTGATSLKTAARLAKSYFGPTPSYLILFVTSVCNARCSFCFYWKSIDHPDVSHELTLEEYEKISSTFRDLFYLSIGGGEPMLRGDLADIIYLFYRNSGTRFFNTTTNGAFPEKTYETIRDVLRRCPGSKVKISLSIDAVGVKHDEIRSIKGLFDKILETHRLLTSLNDENLAINVATTLSSLNKHLVYELIDYVRDHLQINDHSMSYVRGDVRDPKTKDVTPEEYKQAWTALLDGRQNTNRGYFRIFNNIIRSMYEVNQDTLESDRMVLPCLAGKKFVTIDEKGNVFPCEIISDIHKHRSFNMGNLRDWNYDINRLLARDESKEIVSFIKDTKCHCTFECANLCNIAFSKRRLPGLVLGR